MAMLLACGASGLWIHRESWQRLDCPLPCPGMLVRDARRLAVADEAYRMLWLGQRLIPMDGGMEAVMFWHDNVLALSGDTDCLTLWDGRTGMRLITAPVGVYPQDMCLLPDGNAVAVCGGADGTLRILTLPDLLPRRMIRLPGNVQRVACTATMLYVLCAQEEEGLRCLLYRVPLRDGRYDVLSMWPGLPGAVHADASGRVYIAASEVLATLAPGSCVPQPIPGEWGLIRHMDSRRGAVLVSDPVMGRCSLIQGGHVHILREGESRDAKFV